MAPGRTDGADSQRVVLAVVTRPHGVRGAVHAKVFNPATEAIARGATLRLSVTGAGAADARVVTLREARPGRETWVLHFEGCDSIAAAERLRGAEVWLPLDELPEPDDGEFYVADLVGCVVRDQHGETVGTVRDVTSYPSVDALVLDTGMEVPLVDGTVTSIDAEARAIVVDREALPET
jgi:16S rRNA processing protein RimM